MKRGLITWNESELPRSALDRRLDAARTAAKARDVPALVVYTDVWRSNHARSLVNFMPYWGRSLLIVPTDDAPILLCGNSPRVYPWLGTVTYVAELRPTKDFGAELLALTSERGWQRVGILDRSSLPYDIDRALTVSALDVVDINAWEELGAADAEELAMRRHAITKARDVVAATIGEGASHSEHELAAGVERALRAEGMEDVLIRIAEGTSAPRPPSARLVDGASSVFVACEYLGHWVQLSRPLARSSDGRRQFLDALADLAGFSGTCFELTGAASYRALPQGAKLARGRVVALHLTTDAGTIYGDTCSVRTETTAELL